MLPVFVFNFTEKNRHADIIYKLFQPVERARTKTCKCIVGVASVVGRCWAGCSDASKWCHLLSSLLNSSVQTDSWSSPPVPLTAPPNSPPTSPACPLVSSALPNAFDTQLEKFPLNFYPLSSSFLQDFLW